MSGKSDMMGRFAAWWKRAGAEDARRRTLDLLRWIIVGLSVTLIVYISVVTFRGIDFMHDDKYLRFQFWVCTVFTADFFIELLLTPRGSRRKYVKGRWVFLLISIPWLTLIRHFDIGVPHAVSEVLRFIPLARGVLALAIVYDYLSRNVVTTIFFTYVSILLTVLYFGALVFFEREQGVNPQVSSFWDALWWAASQVTTLGCNLYPLTVAGKVISVVLTAMGMIMFPLFTVYISDIIVRKHGAASAQGGN